MRVSPRQLACSNFIIASLRGDFPGTVLYPEKGSSVGAFNSISLASPDLVVGLNFYLEREDHQGYIDLEQMFVSVFSSSDVRRPISAIELEERIRDAAVAFERHKHSDYCSVRRVTLEASLDIDCNAPDAVAYRAFAMLHSIVGGQYVAPPQYSLSDLYPRGINGVTASEFGEERYIAEIVYEEPISESAFVELLEGSLIGEERSLLDYAPRLRKQGSWLSGAGQSLDGHLLDPSCRAVHLIARQY